MEPAAGLTPGIRISEMLNPFLVLCLIEVECLRGVVRADFKIFHLRDAGVEENICTFMLMLTRLTQKRLGPKLEAKFL